MPIGEPGPVTVDGPSGSVARRGRIDVLREVLALAVGLVSAVVGIGVAVILWVAVMIRVGEVRTGPGLDLRQELYFWSHPERWLGYPFLWDLIWPAIAALSGGAGLALSRRGRGRGWASMAASAARLSRIGLVIGVGVFGLLGLAALTLGLIRLALWP